jgi:hypothetical protein
VKNPASAQGAARTEAAGAAAPGDADAAEVCAEGAVDPGAAEAEAEEAEAWLTEPGPAGAPCWSAVADASVPSEGTVEAGCPRSSNGLEPVGEPDAGTAAGADVDATCEEAAVALCAWQSKPRNAKQRRIADATAVQRCIFILWLSPENSRAMM